MTVDQAINQLQEFKRLFGGTQELKILVFDEETRRTFKDLVEFDSQYQPNGELITFAKYNPYQ